MCDSQPDCRRERSAGSRARFRPVCPHPRTSRYYDCGNMLHNCSADELRTAQTGLRGAVWLRSKCVKLGIPWVSVLPKEVVNRLHTKEGEEVFLIEGPNNTYRLTPFDPAFQKKMKKAEDIMSRYRNTLNVLSK